MAEDLVQDTFLSAFKSKDSFNGTASEKTWLVSILKNKIIDYYKKASTKRETPLKLRGSVEAPSYDHFFNASKMGQWVSEVEPKDWSDASIRTESKEFYTILQQCLNTLPAKWSGIFTMNLLDEKESKEVCKEFEITSSNFWVIMHRSKLQIRECLEKNWLKI